LPTNETLAKLAQATAVLKVMDTEAKAVLGQVRKCCRVIPKRYFAEMAGMDAGQLSRIIKCERHMTRATLAKLKKTVAFYDVIA
jgi:hypothetical protein